jgi:hypothetical protein
MVISKSKFLSKITTFKQSFENFELFNKKKIPKKNIHDKNKTR